MADQSLKTLHSFLSQNDTKTPSGCTVRSYSHDHGSGIVLIMVHGWPQSAYMYRHVVADLKDKVSMFIPELPGYGFSSRPPSDDKRTVGNIIISACETVMQDLSSRPIIWCSHDRGARVGHRMLVDATNVLHPLHNNLRAGILIDIVPTLEQFRAFANPRASVAYYHWPFLALPNAAELIMQMGGDYFIGMNLKKAGSANAQGQKLIEADGAIEHYCAQFSNQECIEGSCADYAAGAGEDCAVQEEDQKAGRKIQVPLMTIYSASNLGKMHDVDAVWSDWVANEYRGEPIGDGHGHYLPESCPDIVVKLILEWVQKYGK